MSITIEISRVITTNPERMHGAPCFVGTRVPVKTLFDYFAERYTLDEFLADFPTVAREQATAVLREAAESADRSARPVDD